MPETDRGLLDWIRIVRQPDGLWGIVSLVERRWLLTDASKHALHEFIKAHAMARLPVDPQTAIQSAWDACERITRDILKSGCADGVDTLSYQTACNLVRRGGKGMKGRKKETKARKAPRAKGGRNNGRRPAPRPAPAVGAGVSSTAASGTPEPAVS